MKLMKRIAAYALVLVMILTMLPAHVALASTTPEFYVDTTGIEVKAGSTVVLPVCVKNNPGLNAVVLDFSVPNGWSVTGMDYRYKPNGGSLQRSIIYIYDELEESYTTRGDMQFTDVGEGVTAGRSAWAYAVSEIEGDGVWFWITLSIPSGIVNGEYLIDFTASEIAVDGILADAKETWTITDCTLNVSGGIDLSDYEVSVDTQPINGNYKYPASDATALTAVFKAGNTANLKTQWYVCDDVNGTNPVAIGTEQSGLDSEYTPVVSAVGTKYYYCVATNTYDADHVYNAKTDVVSVTVSKGDQAELSITSTNTVTYGNTLTVNVTGGSSTGAVTYAVDGTAATIDADSGVLTPVSVGSVKVTATKAGDDNYNAITSAEQIITITPATINVSGGKELTVKNGGTANIDESVIKGTPVDGSVKYTYTVINGDNLIAVSETGVVSTKTETEGTAKVKVTIEAPNHTTVEETVTVYTKNKQVSSIAITKNPTKMTGYVEGQAFDTTGMEITVTYDDASTDVIKTGFTVEPALLATTTAKVTVTYAGKTADLALASGAVVPKVVTDIVLNTTDVDTDYIIGDEANWTGLVVTANYNDGDTKVLVANEYEISGFDSSAYAQSKTVTVTEKLSGKNYTATFTVKIDKKTLSLNDFTVVVPSAQVYDAETVTVSVTTGLTVGEVAVVYEGGSTPINVGSYKVGFTVAENAIYKAASFENVGTIVINKATPVVTLDKNSLTVVEKASDTVTATVTGVKDTELTDNAVVAVSGDAAVTVSVGSNNVITVNGVTLADKVTVSIKYPGNNNYNEATASFDVEVIDKIPVAVTFADAASKTYTGTAFKLGEQFGAAEVPSGFDFSKIVYVYNQKEYTLDELKDVEVTEAGTYIVKAVFVTDTHKGAKEAKFVINKAAQSELIVVETEATYGVKLELTTNGGNGDGAVKFSVSNGTGKASIVGGKLVPTKVGTVTVTATKAESKNYLAATSAAKTIEIKQAPVTITVNPINVTYTGKALDTSIIKGTATANGKAVDGTWTWVEQPSSFNASTTAYNAKVKFTPDSSNYATPAAVVAEVTISKATPIGAPEYTKITTANQTLAAANLTVGTITPAGTIVWNDSSDTVVEANKAYGWKFTPEDTTNYNELVGELIPYVYNIIVPNVGINKVTAENGVIKMNANSVTPGLTVVFTAEPNEGYFATEVLVVDAYGTVVPVTSMGNGRYSFTMPETTVSIKVVFALTSTRVAFIDVAEKDWFYTAVYYAYDNGLMNGVSSNMFAPGSNLTRGMLMTILARLDGVDTSGGATWYTKGMEWAKATGISDGTKPEANITREQAVTMLFRYAQYKHIDVSVGEDTNILSYHDAFDISEWAIPAMQWGCGSGMIQGNDGNLNPAGTATRAEIATMLMRFVENVVK